MSKNLSKILTIIAFVVGIIAIYFMARIVMEGDDVLEVDADLQGSIISPFITYAKIILIITALLAIVFSIWNLFKHPAQLKMALIGLVAMAVVIGISYVISDDGEVVDAVGKVLKDGEAGTTSKLVSTGIYTTFFLGTIGLAFFVWDFVKSLAK